MARHDLPMGTAIPGMTLGDVLKHKESRQAAEKKKKWIGSKVEKCQICDGPIGKVFYDFSVPTYGGTWGIGCHDCFTSHKGQLGTGLGQKYDAKTLEKVAG